jgi:polyphosphate kinase 2
MSLKEYEKELDKLRVELCKLQAWVAHAGLKAIIVFEGRDAAGKGGTIRTIMERLNPRVFRVVALPAPSERERSQMYGQRHIQQFPAAGEIVIFDRSWYNRAGVEHVMGYSTQEQYQRFLENVPAIERMMMQNGIILIKFWMEVGQEEQQRRFEARISDPLRQWKLSPMDLESYARWYDYSKARDAMLDVTDVPDSPWHIVQSDDKRAARLNCIAQILRLIPYEEAPREKVKLPARSRKNAYDDQATMQGRTYVPNTYGRCAGEGKAARGGAGKGKRKGHK